MVGLCAYVRLSVALTLVVLFATSACGQAPQTQPDKPNDLQSEVDALKSENAAVRELLRKMEAQQKTLLEQVDRLQRRLDSAATAQVHPAADVATTPPPPATEADNTP